MPSAIDVMIWNDTEAQEIVAVPVSVTGREFLQNITGLRDVNAVGISVSMEEFTLHTPPNLRVFFNRDDGRLVALVGKNPLQ